MGDTPLGEVFMDTYKVKDIKLAKQGELLIDWATDHMPVLGLIRRRFMEEKPLKGVTLGAVLHCTKETGVLVRTLEAGGAKVAIAGSNPLSTQDAVVAALAASGTPVYAWREQTKDEYEHIVMMFASAEYEIFKRNERDLFEAIRDGYFEFDYKAADK